MLDSTDLSIALYVPDATMRKFVEDRTLVALVLEGIADLDFIPPAWWERSHTAALGSSPLVASGFGRVTREITTRLAKVPGMEVACIGRSESHVLSITLGEIWMLDWLPALPVRRQFKWIGYFPLDGGPFYPPWEPMLKDVDELVAMSEFGRQVFQQGVQSRRIHLIHHGVDTSVFRPLPEGERLKSHKRFQGKFVVGCVARNQPRKNIPALVKAFASLSSKIENLHLYLHMNPCDVGYDIVTLLRRHRLEGKADVNGPDFSLHQALEDEQLNRLYNLFDVMALPSTGEGFGLPILESMAAGVPVVATDYSACPELLRGRGELIRILTTVAAGTNLIEHAVIDVDDLAVCIEKLYRNPALAKQHSEAGLAFAQTLTWDSLMPKWLELIQSITGVD
jgi:glycosyltransferase involved in cell wall biosynthesis